MVEQKIEMTTIVHLESQRTPRVALSTALQNFQIRYLEAEYLENLRSFSHPKIGLYVVGTQCRESHLDSRSLGLEDAVRTIRSGDEYGRIVVYSANTDVERIAKEQGLFGYNKERFPVAKFAEIVASMVGKTR